jgi:hypothetical protein
LDELRSTIVAYRSEKKDLALAIVNSNRAASETMWQVIILGEEGPP